jgi:hypothetical protein
MNRQEAGKLVSVCMAACPSQSSRIDGERAEAMIDSWKALLEDVPYEPAAAAVRVLLQTRTWMPSVADIRATVAELAAGPVKSGAEAWGSVMKAIGRHGSYRKPGVDFTFDDPATARCVAALGWEELCLSENSVSDRARFIEAYDKIAAQQRKEDTSPLLAAARDARAALGANSGPTPIAALLPKVPSHE